MATSRSTGYKVTAAVWNAVLSSINDAGTIWSGGVKVPAATALYLDGGSDTYIIEQAANVIRMYAGNVNILEIGSTYVAVPPTIPIYLDAGSDTYIQEVSANVVRIVAGGAQVWQASGAGAAVQAGGKLFIDGGGDTYAIENGANNFSIVAGGSTAFSVTATSVLVNGATLKSNGQPGFLAFNSGADITQSTGATIVCDTEVYDELGNFSGGTFTAPVTGRYLFSAVVGTLTGSATQGRGIRLNTSNRSYAFGYQDALATTSIQEFSGSVVADMDAGDTASLVLTLSTGTCTVNGDGSNLVTWFSGRLLP